MFRESDASLVDVAIGACLCKICCSLMCCSGLLRMHPCVKFCQSLCCLFVSFTTNWTNHSVILSFVRNHVLCDLCIDIHTISDASGRKGEREKKKGGR